MAEIKELDRNMKLSWGLFAYMIIGLVLATYALTTIYNNFLLMDQKIKDLEEKIEYVDIRVDKKTARNKDFIDGISKRVHILEKPGSDK